MNQRIKARSYRTVRPVPTIETVMAEVKRDLDKQAMAKLRGNPTIEELLEKCAKMSK